METYQLHTELDNELAPILTIGIGRNGNSLIFGADPATGTITVATEGTVDLTFDAEDFDYISELLQIALGNGL